MDKKICALTMVRNDDVYLRKWVEYYGAELGLENLYVFFDGKDQVIPSFCEKVHTELCDKIPGNVVELDHKRLAFLSDRAAELFQKYDLVIGTDIDEFLVVDPRRNQTLTQYLSTVEINTSISGLGIDVGHHIVEEGQIQLDRTWLSQRHYGRLSTRYTKPAVISKPLRWGAGFHRVKGHNFHIAKDLFVFHFGYFDQQSINARFADPSRIEGGWLKHLVKRSKTIDLVTTHKARKWAPSVRFARAVQTIFRPPYALNKPSMLELILIVRIPERFQKLI